MALSLARPDREHDKFTESVDGTSAVRVVIGTIDPSKPFDNLKDYEYDKFTENAAGETAILVFIEEA